MKKAIQQILSGNILSKALGLLREVLMSKYFGTGEINGGYRIAQSGTLVPINFMTSDSLNSAFIPLYKKYLLEDQNKANTFKWCMFFIFLMISMLIFCILFFYSPFWVSILAPGIDEKTKIISVSLLKIMAVCCPFYLCSALMNYVSMAHDDFKPMSMRNPVQNVGMLLGAVTAYYFDKYELLAWGFTGSYIYFFVWSLLRKNSDVILARPKKLVAVDIRLVLNDFWKVLRPLLLLPIILQGNITLERALSSLVGLDAISSLDYAKFITETVIFFLSVPIAFAGLSAWSGLTSEDIKEKLSKIYTLLVILGMSVSFFLMCYSKSIVIVLFQRGAFDTTSVEMTSSYLQGMSIGLWAQVIGYIFIKALSAQLRNKQVLIVMILSLFGNAIVNIITYKSFGAFGIGLGCSAYGLFLLLTSAFFLGLHKNLHSSVLKMAAGIIIYGIFYKIYGSVSHSAFEVVNLFVNSIVFFCFFVIWIFSFKELRFSF
ncbi:TPA: lipid II flippase MurJ, partial [Escherichia coli]